MYLYTKEIDVFFTIFLHKYCNAVNIFSVGRCTEGVGSVEECTQAWKIIEIKIASETLFYCHNTSFDVMLYVVIYVIFYS